MIGLYIHVISETLHHLMMQWGTTVSVIARDTPIKILQLGQSLEQGVQNWNAI